MSHPAEARAALYIKSITGNAITTSDPIGFLISSHRALAQANHDMRADIVRLSAKLLDRESELIDLMKTATRMENVE